MYLDDECCSIHYFGDCFFGGPYPFTISYYIMINLNTGDLIYLNDLYTITSILTAIENRQCEWIEGEYTFGPDFYSEDTIASFIASINEQLNEVYLSNAYSRNDIRNFGYDGENIYIRFYYHDSLNDFVVLKVPVICLEAADL